MNHYPDVGYESGQAKQFDSLYYCEENDLCLQAPFCST